jgi:hypothetical protein
MLADDYPQVRVAAIANLDRLRPDGARGAGRIGQRIEGLNESLSPRREDSVHPVIRCDIVGAGFPA